MAKFILFVYWIIRSPLIAAFIRMLFKKETFFFILSTTTLSLATNFINDKMWQLISQARTWVTLSFDALIQNYFGQAKIRQKRS